MGLKQALGMLPDGTSRSVEVRDSEITEWLRNNYRKVGGDEEKRRMNMRKRRHLYEDAGQPHFEQMVRDVFTSQEVITQKLMMVPYSKYQNVTKAIVNQKSSVYSQPAQRKVTDRNRGYQKTLEILHMDQLMRERNRYENLQNEVFLSIGVKDERVDGDMIKVPTLNLVTSDNFTAVAHPLIPTELLAIIIDRIPGGIGVLPTDPHFQVWTDTELIWLDKNWRMVKATTNPWGFIPGVLCHATHPTISLLDSTGGQDMIDGHMASVLCQVLLLWGQKTGTKLPYATGDMAATARGQVLDADRLTEFGDGVSPGVLDLGHDPKSLIETSQAILSQLAANNKIPADLFFLTSNSNSKKQLHELRTPLREVRREQIITSRDCEREVAWKMAAILETEADERFRYGFRSWSIDYGEVETPLDPLEKRRWQKESRSLGLRSPIDDIMEENPDIPSRAEAGTLLLLKQAEFAEWVLKQRALQMSPSTDAGTDTDTPEAQEDDADNEEPQNSAPESESGVS